MFITGKHIPRRAMLRGLGVSLALPLLDSMIPALQPLANAAALPKVPRFAGIFSPHGWAPAILATIPNRDRSLNIRSF